MEFTYRLASLYVCGEGGFEEVKQHVVSQFQGQVCATHTAHTEPPVHSHVEAMTHE